MQTLEEALETNRRLNRRLQALEGPWEHKLARANDRANMWASAYRHTFDRLLRAHDELKLAYVEAAKATGAPHQAFHSVMDGCPGWGENPEHVFANAYVPLGVETIRVVDEVKRAIDGHRRPWWRRIFG